MPVIDVQRDPQKHTLTLTAEFAAPVERVWAVYADPRQLERIWGPPMYPATFTEHELAPGGRMAYVMTGPQGDRHYGVWFVQEVDEPRSFSYEDAFADENYEVNENLPRSANRAEFTAIPSGTRVDYISYYSSEEQLQQVIDMGMIEGATGAINQIDALLA